MTAEVAVRADIATAIPAKIQYARALAQSGLLPDAYRDRPANILWALEYAEALGLPPMTAITGVHVIQGKPTASAGLISALVRRAGHRLRVTGDAEKAVAEIVRKDDPQFTFRAEWTMARAQQAGLLDKRDSNWQKYSANMLKHRAVTEVARDACEEALFGIHYTPEELGADVDAEGEPVSAPPAGDKPAEPERATPDDDPWYARDAPPDAPGRPHIGHTLRELHIKFSNIHISKAGEKHATCSAILGRKITSTSQLTDEDVDRVYTKISELGGRDEVAAFCAEQATSREGDGAGEGGGPPPAPGGGDGP